MWQGKVVKGIKECKGWPRFSQSAEQIGCTTPILQWGLKKSKRQEVMAQQAREFTAPLCYGDWSGLGTNLYVDTLTSIFIVLVIDLVLGFSKMSTWAEYLTSHWSFGSLTQNLCLTWLRIIKNLSVTYIDLWAAVYLLEKQPFTALCPFSPSVKWR